MKTQIETVENNLITLVDEQMNNYLLKNVDISTLIISKGATLTNNYLVELSLQYQVRKQLIASIAVRTSTSQGHRLYRSEQRRRTKQSDKAVT